MPVFDPRAAKLLVPGQHLTLDEAPGLRLEASAETRSWIYRYKSPVSGLMKQIKVGVWPALGLAQALAKWSELKAMRDAGRCPATEKKAGKASRQAEARAKRSERQAQACTVLRLTNEFADEFAAARRKPKGLAELKRLFRTMLPAEIQALPAAELTRRVAFDLINSYAETPVVASNLRQELGGAWDWAIDAGRLPEDTTNWWRLILRGKLKSKGKTVRGEKVGTQKTVLQPADVGKVIRFLPHMSRLPAQLLTLYLWTGCRGAEICAMEAEEISQETDGWWWTIPKAKTKLAKHPDAVDLRVPLVGRALEVVRTRLELYPSGYLFRPVNKNTKAPHVQQKIIGVAVWWHRPECEERPEQVRARWPVPHFAPHDLRRTVRTQLAALGCPKEVGEAVLGHILPGVEGVYNRHTYDRERREWLSKLDAHWESAAAT